MNLLYSCVIPVWQARFVLMVGKETEYLKKRLESAWGKNATDLFNHGLAEGATQYFTCTKGKSTLQVFAIRLIRTDDITIHHEAVHCAWDILDQRGVGVEHKNHEALTYLADYIAKIIKKQLHK